ncbi:MAG: hypothetical protein ACI837_002653 [Crocinitomicaceae bacterium]|jgi:hypothetical protein
MKKIVFAIFILLIAAACSEAIDDAAVVTPDTLEVIDPEENTPDVAADDRGEVRIFQSNHLDVIEYLKCTTKENGKNTWHYYTAKNKKEIELGLLNHRGMEMVYFFSSPDVHYEIDYIDCGFTLTETGVESQLYTQVIPACQ